MTVQRLVMPLVLIALVFLTACSSVSSKQVLRTTQDVVQTAKQYAGTDAKEEIVWKIRSIYGQ
jgi:outer membrane biogenesis lipoprotein LolB